MGIIGIELRVLNDAIRIDNNPPRHRQHPAVVTVGGVKINTELAINGFHVVRHFEVNAQVFESIAAQIGQQVEVQFVLFNQTFAQFRQLRG